MASHSNAPSPFMNHAYEDAISLPFTRYGRTEYRESTTIWVNLKSPSGRVVKRNVKHEAAHVEALIRAGWELTHEPVNVGMIR